jgi:hypothetical protein
MSQIHVAEIERKALYKVEETYLAGALVTDGTALLVNWDDA